MNIPGFRAEASLYGESGHYRMAGAHTQANGTIQPAAIRGNYWADRCWECVADPYCSYDPYSAITATVFVT